MQKNDGGFRLTDRRADFWGRSVLIDDLLLVEGPPFLHSNHNGSELFIGVLVDDDGWRRWRGGFFSEDE